MAEPACSFAFPEPVSWGRSARDLTLDLWNAICRGLGLSADIAPAKEPVPALRTPTRIAWTSSTLDQIAAGDPQRGAFIAMNCVACHGQGGVSTSTLIPTLAGMDAATIIVPASACGE